jgi:hypothetical protein
MKMPKLVELTWVDTSCLPHWQDEGEIPELIKCHTVGYILRDTKRDVTLAFTYSDDRGTISPMTIPKSCITKRRRIK